MQVADFRVSASVGGEFDGTRRIGNCRRGRMLGGKALDAHVKVEPELKTWLWIRLSNRENNEENGPGRVPLAYWILFLQALYQLIPTEGSNTVQEQKGKGRLTCQIAIVSRHIREVEGHLNACEVLRGEFGAVQVTRSNKTERAKVVYLRIHALDNERQEVRIGVDLELYIRREGKVGRSAAKLCRDGLVKPACGGCKRIRPDGGDVRYAWDDKGKGDSDAAKEKAGRYNQIRVVHKYGEKHIRRTEPENDEHDRAAGEPLATE
jgi:hypothetical protein